MTPEEPNIISDFIINASKWGNDEVRISIKYNKYDSHKLKPIRECVDELKILNFPSILSEDSLRLNIYGLKEKILKLKKYGSNDAIITSVIELVSEMD